MTSALALLGLFFAPAVPLTVLRVEHWTADWRTAFLSDRLDSSHPGLAIVIVNAETLEPYPYLLPVDHGLLADIVAAVDRAGARAIGLDFYFLKSSEKAKDDKLIATLRNAKEKVILGAFESRYSLKPQQLAYQYDFLKRTEARVGYINLQADRDYVIRNRAEPEPESRYRESLSYLLAHTARQNAGAVHERIAWLLPPRDGKNTFLKIEAHALLNGTAQDAAKLKDRIVLIGGEFPFLDRHWTPLSLLTGAAMTGTEVHAHMVAELIDANRSFSELAPLQVSLFLAALALLGIALGWRFQTRRFNFLDWRVVSFAVVVVDALLFKFAHIVLPFTLAAFAWILGVTIGTQLRSAMAWVRTRRFA
jgi:adenylate cyclase